MFDWTKTQNPTANLKEQSCFNFIVAWRQRLSDFVNRKRFNSSWRGHVTIQKNADDRDTSNGQGIRAHFPSGVLRSTFTNILYDYAVIFESFAWLWMIFVILDLLPSDAGRGDKIAFKVFIRDAAVFFQKVIDRLGKILVSLSDCWIETEQSHPQSLPNPAEMSLYQLKRHCSDRKARHSDRTLYHDGQVQFETDCRFLFRSRLEMNV